jgi:hypothetical protein
MHAQKHQQTTQGAYIVGSSAPGCAERSLGLVDYAAILREADVSTGSVGTQFDELKA